MSVVTLLLLGGVAFPGSSRLGDPSLFPSQIFPLRSFCNFLVDLLISYLTNLSHVRFLHFSSGPSFYTYFRRGKKCSFIIFLIIDLLFPLYSFCCSLLIALPLTLPSLLLFIALIHCQSFIIARDRYTVIPSWRKLQNSYAPRHRYTVMILG